MSKLYEKLKHAERARHPEGRAQGSILTDALKRAGEPRPLPPEPVAQAVASQPPAPSSRSLGGYALVMAVGVALGALAAHLLANQSPTLESPALRAQAQAPAALKMDYRLDLTRTGGAAR